MSRRRPVNPGYLLSGIVMEKQVPPLQLIEISASSCLAKAWISCIPRVLPASVSTISFHAPMHC